MFYNTVRIDVTYESGEQGGGTGFLFSHRVDDQEYRFVVTNKHVVMNVKEGSICFLKKKDGKPSLGDGFRMAIHYWTECWFGHPDPSVDIAICPLLPIEKDIQDKHGVELYWRIIESSLLPTPQQQAELDAVEPVTFVGYPNGIWDRKNLLPIARRGFTASPASVDFEGNPCFLIDASVFGGSSGSPVYLADQNVHLTRNGHPIVKPRLFFLGVVASVLYQNQMNEIVQTFVPTNLKLQAKFQEKIDLGIVYKARTVVEAVEAFIDSTTARSQG